LAHLAVSNGFDSVLIAVDNLTRMTHFLLWTWSVTTKKNANVFSQGDNKLHGLPRVIISDRNPKLVNGFWQTLWRRLATRLDMSSSRHPKTDGLTERVNNTFHHLLRCFCCYDGSNWTDMLPKVEFAYNATKALGIEYPLL
jgi:hypothetical protein